MRKYLLVFFCLFYLQGLVAQTQVLHDIIKTYEGYRPYNRSEYPLGVHTDSIERLNAEFANGLLQQLRQLDPEGFSETDRISFELLVFRLKNEVDEYRFGMHLNPLLADSGFHLSLNYRIRPLLNKTDVVNYFKMLRAIPEYTQQHFELIRAGMKRGISQPKIIFEGYEGTYDDFLVENAEESPFYGPLEQLPNNFTETEKDSVRTEGKAILSAMVEPSFRRIKDFFESEYLPKARISIGVSEIPQGHEFYQNRIDYYTTSTAYTADDIHQIGLSEVARIRAQMQKIITDLNFDGSFADFLTFLRTDERFYATTGEELLMHARDIAKRIDAELPKFFKTLPRTPYGVKKVPDALAPKYTGGRYSGPSSDTQPGFYLVNTYKLNSRPLYVLPSLTAHEAVPGHHLQGSLNRELGDSIPRFRRQTYLSAYGEGWALYTEFLASEMGIYTTPYEEFGKLTYEMWRACRLVVDTGIHSKGWSREQAVSYLLEHTALSEHEVNTETDRYISWPGQALSYKMGELKIRELRNKAENELGERFDIREFHEVILEQGTVTLPILEERINKYISNTKA